MKYALTFVLLVLLLTGCNRDARLSRKVVGTWQAGSSMTEVFKDDGSFLFSQWHSNQTNAFSGTWQVKNGFLSMTLTNATAPGSNDHAGDSVSFKIVRVDAHHLTCVMGRDTNTVSR